MFLKLMYRLAGETLERPGWINMDIIAHIHACHVQAGGRICGSCLRTRFGYDDHPGALDLYVDQSPEELMEMMKVNEPRWHAYAVNNVLSALGRLDEGLNRR